MSLWKQFTTLGTGLALCAGLSLSAEAAGLMKPANSQLPDLQISQHHVHVVIEDGYATTTVEQRFKNPNAQDLEALYSFPVPENAAVGEFVYWIDGKPVTGEVVAKQKARQVYEEQKAAGNRVAVTEQDDYRTFDSRIYPVEANGEVRIKLVYIQPAHIDSGVGRYLYPLEDGGVDEIKNAFWTRNEAVQEQFSFTVDLRSSYPLDDVRLPKHSAAQISQLDPQRWRIELGNQVAATEEGASPSGQQPVASLSDDILLYWRLAEGLPGSLNLVSYREPGQQQGTFMLTLTPGDDLPPVVGNRDWIFVLDTSGSMSGKYSTLLEGVRQGLNQLPQGDRFRLITFNNQAQDLSNGYQPVDPVTVERLLKQLEHRGVGGGTNLYAGLHQGIRALDDDRPSAIVLVTDGVANVGTTEKKAFLKLLEQHDVRLFTFIMGNSANRPLLQEMTEVSNGFASSVSNADDVIGQIMLATSKLNHAALRDIELKIDGVRATDLTPEQIGTLYRGEQLTLFGHYFKPGTARIELTGKVGQQARSYTTRIELPEILTDNPELERLWAFNRIEQLQAKLDYFGADADTEQAITDLAVEHGLVTNYTSLLVVEEQVFQQLGDRSHEPATGTQRGSGARATPATTAGQQHPCR